jgi:hypothetical protein
MAPTHGDGIRIGETSLFLFFLQMYIFLDSDMKNTVGVIYRQGSSTSWNIQVTHNVCRSYPSQIQKVKMNWCAGSINAMEQIELAS